MERNPKELRSLFYRLERETLSPERHASEVKDTRYIFGHIPKPKRNEIEQKFMEYIGPLFKSKTTMARMMADLKIVRSKKDSRTDEELIISQFDSLADAQKWAQKYHDETDEVIENLFISECENLNKILNS